MTQSTITVQEQSRAENYLTETRDALISTVTGLTDEQWRFKPTPDGWSISQILEHLVIVEDRVQQRVLGFSKPEADPGPPSQTADQFILDELPQRKNRVQAPEPIQPKGSWTGAEALMRFIASRDRTIELLASRSRLRGWTFSHPIFGPWDGYQWILATAAHTARHNHQLRELMADSGFPQIIMTASLAG